MKYIVVVMIFFVSVCHANETVLFDNLNMYTEADLIVMESRILELERRQVEDEVFLGLTAFAMTLCSHFAYEYLKENENNLEPHDRAVLAFCGCIRVSVPSFYLIKKMVGR